MTRKSNTVEYFPHYADASTSMRKTIPYLESKYGYKGYAVWFKLLECLASSEGHYIPLESPLHLTNLKKRLSIDNASSLTGDELNVILDELANINAIDKELWQGNKIIWSDNFVGNLSTVYSNRHRSLPLKPPLLPTKHLQDTYSAPTAHLQPTYNETTVGVNTPGSKEPTENLQATYREPTDISRVEEVERSRVEEYCRSAFSEMIKIYEEEFAKKIVTPMVAEELKDIYSNYGLDIFKAAVKRVILNNKGGRNLRYIRPILEDFKLNGIPSDNGSKPKGSIDPPLTKYKYARDYDKAV